MIAKVRNLVAHTTPFIARLTAHHSHCRRGQDSSISFSSSAKMLSPVRKACILRYRLSRLGAPMKRGGGEEEGRGNSQLLR